MKLSVGQIVFLLTSKSSKVYPALVCEEIKKKSLSGETISHVVRLPTEDEREVELSMLDAEIFETIDSARETIIDRISNQVDEMLSNAISMSSVFSNDVINPDDNIKTALSDTRSSPDDLDSSEEDYAIVDLGDGNIARMSVKNANEAIGS